MGLENIIMYWRVSLILTLASAIYLSVLVYIWLFLVLELKEFLKSAKSEDAISIIMSSKSLLKTCNYLEVWGMVGIVIAVLMTFTAVIIPVKIDMKLMLTPFPATVLLGSVLAIREARELKHTP